MTQEQIEALAKSIHDGADAEGTVACYAVLSDAMHKARCTAFNGIMAQLGNCAVQLSKMGGLSSKDATLVLAELLLGKVRAMQQKEDNGQNQT